MNKCDIIIPIYNAYDCLGPCIDSVIKYTDLNENRIILINDKSTDERVVSLLKEYALKNDSIVFLQNKENKGFVGTVNVGMKYSSKNDVLLLNSDTEVTSGWLDKIKKCAYSSELIATVTPLSNNATLASVPKCFEPNQLPEGISLEEMSKYVENASYNEYPDVYTGHGFCLYIKREVLKKVGFFDEEAFGKGYGEENDFCFRCLDNGYKNVICDNTYILHKESQSFSSKKDKLIKQGFRVLNSRYPDYFSKLSSWCNIREIEYIGNNVAFELGKNNDKPNVLFVIHDFHDIKNNLGGTSLHAYDIIRNLRNKYNFHVLTPEYGYYKVYSFWSNNESESFIKFPNVTRYNNYPFLNNNYRLMINKIVKMFNINIAHIHHLIGNFLDVIDVLKENNIYTIITLHDYFSVCNKINKINKQKKYCGNPSVEVCAKCMKNHVFDSKRQLKIVNSWRDVWHKYLNKCDLIIAPSNSAKKEVLSTFKDLKIKVIEHGVDIEKKYSNIVLEDKNRFDVAFVGAIGMNKGSDILRKMIAENKKLPFNLHLFGKLDRPMPSNTTFTDHGIYKREELPALLEKNNIKIVCLLSNWPETYSYTLTEVISCGVPVIAFDFGAIAERIKKYNLGWVIPINSNFSQIKNKINEILNDKDAYKNKINSINKYKIKTTNEMTNEYDLIYSKNLFIKENTRIDDVAIKEHIRNYNNVTNYILYPDYSWVFATFKWKLINKIKIPNKIKNIYSNLKK